MLQISFFQATLNTDTINQMTNKILKNSLFAAVIIILLASSWFTHEFNTRTKSPARKTNFEVLSGQSVSAIARELKDNKIIKRTWPFLGGYRLFFSPASLKAGEYSFLLPLSTKDVLSILIEGHIILHSVTIPEGLTRSEISEHLNSQYSIDKDSFLHSSLNTKLIYELDKEAKDLEGYLFPETYHFPKDTTADKIVSSLIDQFKKTFSDEEKGRAEELGMTIREVVILASIIEKETSLPGERSLVSAVFHNRLRIGMKLDCDPTIVYALKQAGKYKGRLYTKDLKLDSPYNTYLNRGFPPGPIANPGQASLKAALYPADVKYLYFVSRNNGSHQFSLTFREHQNAVNKYQK